MASTKRTTTDGMTLKDARNVAADCCDALRKIQTQALSPFLPLTLTDAQAEALLRAVEALRDFDRAVLGA